MPGADLSAGQLGTLKRNADRLTRPIRLLESFASPHLGNAPAAAEWEYVDATTNSIVYGDPDGATATSPGMVKLWFLYDHGEARFDHVGSRNHWSTKHLVEVDCGRRKVRWLRMEKYSGRMASGEQTSGKDLDNPNFWGGESVTEGTRAGMLDLACNALGSKKK